MAEKLSLYFQTSSYEFEFPFYSYLSGVANIDKGCSEEFKGTIGLALPQIKLIIFPNNRCTHVFFYGNGEITSVDLEKFVFFAVLRVGDFLIAIKFG